MFDVMITCLLGRRLACALAQGALKQIQGTCVLLQSMPECYISGA